MNQDQEGRLNYAAGIDDSDLVKGAERIDEVFEQTGDSAEAAGKRIDNAFSQAGENISESFESGKEVVEDFTDEVSESIGKVEELIEQTEEYSESLDDVSESVEKAERNQRRINLGTKEFSELVKELPSPLRDGITSLQNLTKAAMKFIATPLGAVIGALVLVFQALSSWFTKSAEGQMAFAKVSGYVTGILDQLREIGIKVGEAIYKAVTNPKEAIKNFGESLRQNILNRIQAALKAGKELGNMFEILFTPSRWGELGESFERFGNYLIDTSTGIENTLDKLGNTLSEYNEAGKENSAIAVEKKRLEQEIEDWEIARQEYERKKSELRGMMMDSSVSNAQKQAYLAKYRNLVNEEYEIEKGFSDRKIALQERSMALTSNSLEDERELKRLQQERATLDTNRQQSLSQMTRMTNSFTVNARDISTFEEEARNYSKKVIEINRELRNNEIQAEIDSMEDGAAKTIRQLQLSHTLELQELERSADEKKEAYIQSAKSLFEADANNKNQAFNREAFINSDEYKAYAQRIDALIQVQKDNSELLFSRERLKEEEDAMNEYLEKFGTYQERRMAIINKYENQRRSALNDWQQKSIDKEQEAELHSLDELFGKSAQTMADLFADASKKTVNEIDAIIRKYQGLVDLMESKGDGTLISIDELQEIGLPEDVLDKLNRGEIKIKDVTDRIKELKDELAGKSAWRTFANDMASAINTLKNADGDISKIGKGITGIGDAVSEFSGQLQGFGSSLANIFGFSDSDIQSAIEGLDGLGQTASGVGQMMSGDLVGGIMSAVQGVSKLTTAFREIHDRKYERRIQKLTEQIDVLKKSYDSLGDSIEEAYSKDASSLIEQQNTLLKQQKVLIEQQIKEEEKKKKTDKNRIKEYQEQIDEINKLISENERKAVDAIFGEDVKSAIDNFASAYAEAWSSATDKAASAKDTVRKMMQQMVTESIKAAIQSSGKMQEIRDKLQEFYADNILTGWEQDYIYNMAESLQKELDNQFSWADSLMKSGSSSSQSSSSRGFETITQDQAVELSGRFTGLQMSGDEISRKLDSITESQSEARTSQTMIAEYVSQMIDLQAVGVSHLEAIEKNTSQLSEMNDRLGKIEKNTRSL